MKYMKYSGKFEITWHQEFEWFSGQFSDISRVRNSSFILPFLLYSDFFDDNKVFANHLSQSLVIHEVSKTRTKPNTFFSVMS